MKPLLHGLLLFCALLAGTGLRAAETIPPAPEHFFNDYTQTVSAGVATSLDQQLAQYERDSSNQLVVAVFSHMQSDSSIEDYTVRVAQAWHTGQQGKNNGAVLFVFKDDRKLYIQVGYGLEATLTDANAHSIIETILKPAFRSGNFDQGFTDAVQAMIAATKGEYQGTGQTHAEAEQDDSPGFYLWIPIGIVVFLVITSLFSSKNQVRVIHGRRRLKNGRWVPYTTYVSTSNSSYSGSSSSSDSSSGSSYSGGGGSFGGGGAGGSW